MENSSPFRHRGVDEEALLDENLSRQEFIFECLLVRLQFVIWLSAIMA